jgi:hypothetical protein
MRGADPTKSSLRGAPTEPDRSDGGDPGRAGRASGTILPNQTTAMEATMETLELTVEDLKGLPLRALVAWATRCARRVQPLVPLPEGQPETDRPHGAVEVALRMAEDFAQGAVPLPVEDVIHAVDVVRGAATAGGDRGVAAAVGAAAEAAHATASALEALGAAGRETTAPAEGTAADEDVLDRIALAITENTALAAHRAAEEAVAAVGEHNEDLIQAAYQDYLALLRLDLGRFPNEGQPVDPSPDGPLGPL